MFKCEIFNILFSYKDENVGRVSNLHQCIFKEKFVLSQKWGKLSNFILTILFVRVFWNCTQGQPLKNRKTWRFRFLRKIHILLDLRCFVGHPRYRANGIVLWIWLCSLVRSSVRLRIGSSVSSDFFFEVK